MTCRHSPGDRNCTSHPDRQYELQQQRHKEEENKKIKEMEELLSRTPNPKEYEILRTMICGKYMTMEVKYSSCKKCSYDSKKIMVFENVSYEQVIHWRTIDPHFKDPSETIVKEKKVSPSPIARFPGSELGWKNAINYCEFLMKNITTED